MNLGLSGRVALVAGASQGLGRAVALALAREGARVSLSSRSLRRAKLAARDIAGRVGAEVMAAAADVRDPIACRAWVEGALGRWGRLDILVINAGGPAEGSFEEAGDADWKAGFEQNLMSGVRLARFAIAPMKKQGWGRIIFIASTSAKQPIEGLVISNTIRTGILGLSKTLSQELGPHNVLVNVVCPGYTTTERLEDLARHTARRKGISLKRVYDLWASGVPLRRLARPEEIADAVAFLASERASYITGAVLQVDGGRIASPF